MCYMRSEGRAEVHVFGGFHGRELDFLAAVHEKGGFHGWEPIFELAIHIFGGFHGWEVRMKGRSGMENR